MSAVTPQGSATESPLVIDDPEVQVVEEEAEEEAQRSQGGQQQHYVKDMCFDKVEGTFSRKTKRWVWAVVCVCVVGVLQRQCMQHAACITAAARCCMHRSHQSCQSS